MRQYDCHPDCPAQQGLSKPETFAFLGFTFICGKTRRGRFQLQRKTRRDRMRTKLQEIKGELRRRITAISRTRGMAEDIVNRHFAYFAVPQTSGRCRRSGIM